MSNKKTNLHRIGILLGAAALATGCGQQAFVASSSKEALRAPGTFTIPAKVDFLLVEDDTGSMNEVFSPISSAMPSFLNGLEDNGWDYHFATMPLTTRRDLNQVVASHYDANWGGSWTAPFPGASMDLASMITASVFRTASNYTGFISLYDLNNGLGGKEPGLENIAYQFNLLSTQRASTNFLRDDAMLVVLMVGNGDDTSRINYCVRPSDGLTLPCEDLGQPLCTNLADAGRAGATCGSKQISLNYFKSQIQGVKTSSSLVRFYSAVSSRTTYPQTCLGGYAYQGGRYQQMAAALNGASYDICAGGSSAVANTLASMTQNLQNARIGMRTRYLFIGQDADVSSIVVTRSTGEVIPQSATNGWTYLGYRSNLYAIDYPVQMNMTSGYAIELHGSARLIGEQTADVSYRTQGLQNSPN